MIEKNRDSIEQEFGTIYHKYKYGFISTLSRRFPHLDISDIESLYHDAILETHKHIIEKKINDHTRDLAGYITKIGKCRAIDMCRSRKIETVELIDDSYSGTHEVISEMEKKVYHAVFVHLKEQCRTILEMYYYLNYSMDKIAQELKMASSQVAKTSKNRCMKKLTDLIK